MPMRQPHNKPGHPSMQTLSRKRRAAPSFLVPRRGRAGRSPDLGVLINSFLIARRRSLVHLVSCASLLMAGCASIGTPGAGEEAVIELPAVRGWFNGQPLRYVTTDVSDAGMAAALGVNFVPRLADAQTEAGAPRGARSAVDKVYMFPPGSQGNVFPSAPVPTGPGNADRAYSPLWVVVQVAWREGRSPRLLNSEEQVLAAVDAGLITLTPTRIVVNCPVVQTGQGGTLAPARVRRR